eukprot:COSAG02_NODE_17743_length_984_cov_1.020339_2_plen_100_part_01
MSTATWDDDELVVARTLSGDRNSFSLLLGDGQSTRSELPETAREEGVSLSDSWQQPSAAGAGTSMPHQPVAVQGLSRTTPLQTSTLGSDHSLWNRCQASS